MTVETITNVPNTSGYVYVNPFSPQKCECHQCTQARYEMWRSQAGIGQQMQQMQNGGNQ